MEKAGLYSLKSSLTQASPRGEVPSVEGGEGSSAEGVKTVFEHLKQKPLSHDVRLRRSRLSCAERNVARACLP